MNVEKYIISKEDFKRHFKCRKIISKKEYYNFLKNVNDFNAIFNATPEKSYKKRDKNI